MIDLGTRVKFKEKGPNERRSALDYEYGVVLERNDQDYGVAETVKGKFTGNATWWFYEDALEIIPTKTKMRHALIREWEANFPDEELAED